jgi:uncharacterized protein YndB with AHSA1/START domain
MTAASRETTTTTSDLDLVIQRQFNAPRELVYKAWTEPERLMQWWSAPGVEAPAFAIDLRVDGSWRAAVVTPDGAQHWAYGRYVELDEPERIAFTFNWESAEDVHDTLITIDLAEQGDQTLMTFRHATFRNVEERDGHNEGWTNCFDQLDTYLSA